MRISMESVLFLYTYLIRMVKIQVFRKLAPHLETSKMMKAFLRGKNMYLCMYWKISWKLREKAHPKLTLPSFALGRFAE